jgi:catecholate siderophore receptor
MTLLAHTSLLALSLASTAPALAQSTAPAATASASAASEAGSGAAANSDAADPIVVTGQRLEYGVRATSSATRTSTDIRNIPQALTVVSESQIEDQALRSIAEVLMFVPGATPGTSGAAAAAASSTA